MAVTSLAAHAAYQAVRPVVETTPAAAPTADNTRDYRDALGRFGTGVTVITTATEVGLVGMTANSFASVSLTPALVLWSLSKNSGRFVPFSQAQHYAIHVMSQEQQELALRFAREGDCFNHCDWQMNDDGVPIIDNALACFECTLHSRHDAGDHVIILGEVERFRSRPGSPLIFANGGFGEFQPGS